MRVTSMVCLRKSDNLYHHTFRFVSVNSSQFSFIPHSAIKNHRMAWVGSGLKDHPAPTRLPQAWMPNDRGFQAKKGSGSFKNACSLLPLPPPARSSNSVWKLFGQQLASLEQRSLSSDRVIPTAGCLACVK